jgi:DNA-binding MarR family transcriptional regulator
MMGDERELADRLHSAAVRLLRHARTGDAASGVTAARLSVLSVLVYGHVRTVSELAAAEQVAVPTMTRLLQDMEADGLVKRRRAVQDLRVVNVAVTARGRRALNAGRAARLELIRAVLARLAAREQDALSASVDSLLRALQPSAGNR